MRSVLPALSGALVVTAWSAFSWIVLPFHSTTLRNLPPQAFDAHALRAAVPEAGVYRFPGVPPAGGRRAWELTAERAARGPVISLVVLHPNGREVFSGPRLLAVAAVNVAAATLMVHLLGLCASPARARRALVVLAAASFAALLGPVANGVWLGAPLSYTLTMAGDTVIGWTLAGLLLAWWLPGSEPAPVVRPRLRSVYAIEGDPTLREGELDA